jgi:hypothetical protein
MLFANLVRRRFAANNVVAFNDRGDSNGFVLLFVLPVNADNAPMRTNEDFCTASYFSRQGESKINLCAGSKVFLHGEVNAPRGNIASLTVVRPRLSINRQADAYR